MAASRQQSILLAVAALAIVLLLALFAWISSSGRDRSAPVVHAPEAETSSPSATPDAVAPLDSETSAHERSAVPKPAAPKVANAHGAPSAAPAASSTVTLVATFARPDKTALEIASGAVELRDAQGALRRAEVHRQRSVQINGLVPGIYVAHVIAAELDHRQQFIDLSHPEQATSNDHGEPVIETKLVLWPSQWIAVIVETTDSRPFSALATDLGYEPMKLFVGAFQVHTQLGAPRDVIAQSSADASEAQRGESALARFRPPPDYKSWELTKSCVGSLELVHAPPMWVELELFGKPVGWESLQPGAREIVFRIDRAALDERFARVTARIVDPKDHAPIEKAFVTLRADNSSHRRKDQTNVPSKTDGRVVLEHIVPGRYEFAVARGDSQHQEMIQLGIGEHRDLGDIELGESKGIDVIVVDEDGKPPVGPAAIEIGPFKKETTSSEIYPQMMRHHSGQGGVAHVPMPSEPAIIRAAVELGRSHGPSSSQEVHGVRSANALIDPRSPPSGPIRLTMMKPVNVRIVTRRTELARIEILDELDVIVARSVRDTEKILDADLVPGRYRARTVTPAGVAGLAVPFVADRKQSEIQID